jgi:hypothetical protein
MSASMMKFNLLRIFLVQVALIFAPFGQPYAAEPVIDMRDPTQVIEAYLRATYARDFVQAYRFISAEDRRGRDLDRYVRQRGPFSGFTLEVAKRLSHWVDIRLLEKQETPDRIHAVIAYRVADPKKIGPLVLNWDPYRLNVLSGGERRDLLDTLDKKRHDGSIHMSQGEEKFELVKEGDEWRIFLNWAAGIKIPLRVDLSRTSDLDVALSRHEFVLQPGELFEVSLKIRNKTNQPVTTRIGHLVEPQAVADYLDFVQCGFLLPVTLVPGKEQEFSGTYMLRGSLPEGVHQMALSYEFRVVK